MNYIIWHDWDKKALRFSKAEALDSKMNKLSYDNLMITSLNQPYNFLKGVGIQIYLKDQSLKYFESYNLKMMTQASEAPYPKALSTISLSKLEKDRLKTMRQTVPSVHSLPIIRKSASKNEKKSQQQHNQRQLKKFIDQIQGEIKVLKKDRDEKAKRSRQLVQQIDELRAPIKDARIKNDWIAFNNMVTYRISLVKQIQIISAMKKQCCEKIEKLDHRLLRLKSNV